MFDIEALMGGNRPPQRALPIHEAQIATLREIGAIYAQPCRFKVGDLVTPRADCMYKGAGLPWLVLEVRDGVNPDFDPDMDPASNGYGQRRDVRVAGFHESGNLSAYWQESTWLIPYDPAMEAQAQGQADADTDTGRYDEFDPANEVAIL